MSKAYLALLLVALIYGLFYVAIKQLVTEISPWETFCLRLTLAVPLFYLLERCFFHVPVCGWQDRLQITGLGLLGIGLVQYTIMVGMKWTTVFHAGFIVGTAPLITLVLSVLMKQEKMYFSKLLGIAIAMVGLVLLLSARSGQEHLPPHYLWGDLIVFINIACWALFLIISRPMLKKYPAFSLTSHAFVHAGIVILPLMLLTLHHFPGVHLSPAGWLWMLFVVIFATIISYSLNYYALSFVDASTVAIFVLLQPFMTALFAFWILQEPITLPMVVEGCVIIAGVFIAMEGYQVLKQGLFSKKNNSSNLFG